MGDEEQPKSKKMVVINNGKWKKEKKIQERKEKNAGSEKWEKRTGQRKAHWRNK